MSETDFTDVLVNNVKTRFEETKKFSVVGINTEMNTTDVLQNFVIDLNRKISEKIYPLIVGTTSAPVFEYNGKKCETVTRKLSARIECFGDTLEDYKTMVNSEEILERISTEIADEFKMEYEYNQLNDFHPMILADTGGIVLDPVSFNPVISFLSRYYAAPKEEI